MAGAVYLLFSSQDGCDVTDLGYWYAGPGNTPLVVLVRDEAGDSATGEKYESPPRAPGDGAPALEPLVCTGGTGKGNRGGGGARAMLAMEWTLSPVMERPLVLDPVDVRVMLELD